MMMESSTENNEKRRMLDTLVAGYLGRQRYVDSLKCFMNESPILNAAQASGMSIILSDIVHGKHLEEIVMLFSECGNFGLTPALLDFGLRLRSLANEFTSLTNGDARWSDTQKMLYGKHVSSSRSSSQQCVSASNSMLDVTGTNQNMLPAGNVDSTTSISSQRSTGSASTRRKCTQPVSINARRREFMKEVVEPVVQTAQQIIDSGNITDPNSSLSAVSMITIDENAVGTLDRCMAHENFAELIESIEKDFPDGFFDSFPSSDITENLHQTIFETSPSQSNEIKQDQQQANDNSQNLYNIPQADLTERSAPLCSSTPTKFKSQEKPSAMFNTPVASSSNVLLGSKPKLRRLQPANLRKKPVVAESAMFKERIEVECPYLPIGEAEKVGNDSVGQDLLLDSTNLAKADDDPSGRVKVGKLEISAGWRKLAEMCDESNKKVAETEDWRRNDCPEICQTASQSSKDPKGGKDSYSSPPDLEITKKVRSEACTSSSSSDYKTLNSTDGSNQQKEKFAQEKETTEDTKLPSKSSFEREIELLFESLEDEDSRGSQTRKNSEWKGSETTRPVPISENNKNSESRDGILGEENLIVGNYVRQTSGRFVVDKKKRKPVKQKPAAGDFVVDSKISASRKRQLEETHVSLSLRDHDRHGDSSVAGNSALYKTCEQFKKQEKFKKLEENREDARVNIERRKKEKEFQMKREREEVERQKREVEEKELRRAAERERKRKEEEQREAFEKEEREKRRREREERERLKKIKEKEEKLKNNDDPKKHRERFRDGKSRKELKNNIRIDYISDESNEASILDKLFGDDDSLRPVTKIPEREEMRRKPEENCLRSPSVQKSVGKVKLSKEDYRPKREKAERGADAKVTKNARDGSSGRPDALDDLFNCIVSKPSTSRKDEADIIENKPHKKIVVSGVNKGRENLLVGGGHSARVGMVLEKATRIRTKHEHEEKMKHDYRKLESVRRATSSSSEHNARKRILDLPIPKTPDLLSQILKPDISSSRNDSIRRSVSAKNISNCPEANIPLAVSSRSSISSKSTTAFPSSSSNSVNELKLHDDVSSGGIGSASPKIKKPRLDMAAIDAVLQSLHELDRASSSCSSLSLSTASASGSEQKLP